MDVPTKTETGWVPAGTGGAWPTRTVTRTVEGQRVQVRIPYRLLNQDDPDVGYVYAPWRCQSAGPDYDEVVARGIAKAQFAPASVDLDARLRPLIKTLTVLAPLATTKTWTIDIGPGERWEQWGIQAAGQLKGRNWVATFTVDSGDKTGRARIYAALDCRGVRIGEMLPVGPKGPDLRRWAQRALVKAQRARRLQAELVRLGVEWTAEEYE